MTELQRLESAVSYLRDKGAARDALSGQWLLEDGTALGRDPVGAAKALRHRMIAKAIEKQRASGRGFTR